MMRKRPPAPGAKPECVTISLGVRPQAELMIEWPGEAPVPYDEEQAERLRDWERTIKMRRQR